MLGCCNKVGKPIGRAVCPLRVSVLSAAKYPAGQYDAAALSKLGKNAHRRGRGGTQRGRRRVVRQGGLGPPGSCPPVRAVGASPRTRARWFHLRQPLRTPRGVQCQQAVPCHRACARCSDPSGASLTSPVCHCCVSSVFHRTFPTTALLTEQWHTVCAPLRSRLGSGHGFVMTRFRQDQVPSERGLGIASGMTSPGAGRSAMGFS